MARRFIFLGKGLITLALVSVLFISIKKEYRAAEPVLSVLIKNRNRLINSEEVGMRARTSTLNTYMPASYEPLAEFIESHGQKNKEKIRVQYVDYYEKVVEFVPNQADAYALLGFCYYYLGETEKAMSAYQRAIFLNPQFFWSAYSLGVIYFKNAQYISAITVFKKALASYPEATLTTLYHSRIYRPLIKVTEAQLQGRLKDGYENIYILLVLSSYHLKNFSDMAQYCQYAIKANFAHPGFFYHHLGLALTALGEKDSAARAFSQAIVLNRRGTPTSPEEGIGLEVF